MPTVTINIAGRGTPTSDGGSSATGHMWYSLTDNGGNTVSYGFSPDHDHQGQPLAPGAVNVHGYDDSYYQGRVFTQTHVEQFKTAQGQILLDTQVENLVTAMAAFAPPAAGQTTLSQTTRDALTPVLAANWHAQT